MRIFLNLFFCLLYLNGNAQSLNSKKIFVTLNPFSIMERDGGITPGIGYHFNDKLAVYSDLGFIFFQPGTYTGQRIETGRLLGYKIKPAIRYTFNEKTNGSSNFIELESIYKQVNYNGTNSIALFDTDGMFLYNYRGYTIRKNVFGGAFKFGKRKFITDDKKLGIDFFVGLGGRKKSLKVYDIPTATKVADDLFEPQFFNYFFSEGSSIYFPAGVKLIYKL